MHVLSRSCQKRVIRVGIKEFRHLKKSLHDIESNTKKSQKLENSIRSSGTKVKSLKSEIKGILRVLIPTEEIEQTKQKISYLEPEIEKQKASCDETLSLIKKKGAMEGFPTMMFSSAEKKIKDELREKIEKKDLRRSALRALVMIIVLSHFIPDWIADYEDYYLPWTCDNGEVIEQTSLQDGVNDCSDGSDEAESGFWDPLTRAEGDTDNYQIGWVLVVGVLLLGGIFLVLVAYGSAFVAEDIKLEDELLLYPGYAEALKENQRLGRSLTKKQNKLSKLNSRIMPLKNRVKKGEDQGGGIITLERKLKNQEKKKLELESEAASVAEETDTLWEGIRHLLPHSNLLKLD